MRIAFFGTPQFAATILDYLLKQSVTVAAVITRPDKPRGRHKAPLPSPVKELALRYGLPLYQPLKASTSEFVTLLAGLEADFFIVAAYAEILKEELLNIPRLGSLNVHASLLPHYRGAAPIARALMAGERETGITIMKMAARLDAGEILGMRKIEITLEMTTGSLTERLADLGKELLWEVMQQILQGTSNPIAQTEADAHYAKKLTSAEGEIHWNRPCEEVHNHIRGFTPNPGAWCWIWIRGERKRLLIHKTLPEPSLSAPIATLLAPHSKELLIGCSQGMLRLLHVQLEGKKSLPVEEFLRGFPPYHLKFS